MSSPGTSDGETAAPERGTSSPPALDLPASWSAWECLRARAGCKDPILSASFLQPWLASFGAGTEPAFLADGIAVLASERPERHGGLPVRAWRLCVNDHSQRAPLLYTTGRERETATALVDFMRSQRHRIDAFRLRGLPADSGLADTVIRAAGAAGMAGHLDFKRSQFALDLTAFAGADAYFASRGTTTEHTIRKQGRRLGRLGTLSVRTAGGEDLIAGLAEFKAVEQRSWKSRHGEILSDDAAVDRFYGALVQNFDRRSGACIWTLCLEDRAIASAITLREGRHCLGLKLVFDEEFAAFSPGRQLVRSLIEAQFRDGCERLDFFSGMEAWRHWANASSTYHDVTLWSPTFRGRALAKARRGLQALKVMARRDGHAPVRRGDVPRGP